MNDRDVHAYAAFPREQIVFSNAAVPISQANLIYGIIRPYKDFPSGQPGYALYGWRVENVQVFCTAIAATATVGVDVELVTFTNAITPVAGSVVQATFAGTLLARTGRIGDRLNYRVNTNGTGTVTNLVVTVTIRPFPMVGDA